MSDDKPTRAQLAAARRHDPNTCTEGCRLEHHGDQAYSAEEVRIAHLEAELAKTKPALAAVEKLKNELVYASNGGPSRELAIVTLGEALKANRELRAEIEQLKVERDSQASLANAYMRERNSYRAQVEAMRKGEAR